MTTHLPLLQQGYLYLPLQRQGILIKSLMRVWTFIHIQGSHLSSGVSKVPETIYKITHKNLYRTITCEIF